MNMRRRVQGRPTVESLLGELDVNSPSFDRQKNVSAATKDLDNLMASLSGFTNTPDANFSPYSSSTQAKSAVRMETDSGQLYTVTDNLQSDLSKHGISNIPKGECSECKSAIIGQVVIALGKMWHPEHFRCAHCGEELGHRNFYERSGCAYCENDYHNLFSPRCAYCNGPIKDRCITALERTWHPEHFFCAKCGKEFGEEGFHEKDGRPFCRKDYFAYFAPRCSGCQKPITNNYITALNLQWHPECFVCQDCKQPFVGGSFFEHFGQPYCEIHYHEKRGSLCAGCHKPISGRCVTAMGEKFHPEHFICSFCLKQLTKGTFKEHQNKPYCHKCFGKLLS
ncbi:LIM domain protein [Trichuris suis]|nr:LIM domain protein [Trichuris suis]